MTHKADILVVDDEPDLCYLMAMYLEDYGYNVSKAYSGNEAAELIAKKSFDLVISDIRMPNGDGISLLKRIKEKDPELPVVLFITAVSDLSVPEAYNMGAEAFFRKPIEYEKLVEKIEECLRRRTEKWRRAADRFDLPPEVEATLDSFQTAMKHQVLNIGRGGMFLKFEKDFPAVDQSIGFHISFADGEHTPIAGRGVCRWVRDVGGKLPSGVGVEFTELDEKTFELLEQYLARFKTQAFIPIA